MYKTKDFLIDNNQNDISTWISTDKKYTVTTSTHSESKYFVYVWLVDQWEWVGITELTLANAVEELNKMIKSGEIEKYV